MYKLLAHLTAIIHLIIIGTNIVSIPFLMYYTPFYVYVPLITILLSPLLGGVNCIINIIENHFRFKAGLPLIKDRLGDLFTKRNK